MLGIECASKAWFRFIITGDVIGGRLKTPADADKESLQAKWIRNINEVDLRSSDILSIIEKGRNYYQLKRTNKLAQQWHVPIMPIIRPHKKLLLRLIVIVRQKSRYLFTNFIYNIYFFHINL